jgi:hypothetical protein
MESTFLPSPSHENWKALYRAAILETNKTHILQKLSTAEQAILARGRELFHAAGTREEMESRGGSLCFTRVRSAWERTEAA